jgi:hypothetical protein
VLSPAVHGGRGNGDPPVRCDLVEYRLDYRSFGKNCIVWQRAVQVRAVRVPDWSSPRTSADGSQPAPSPSPRRQHNVVCVLCYRGGHGRILVDTCAAVRRQGIGDVARCYAATTMACHGCRSGEPELVGSQPMDVFGPQPFVAAGPRQVLRPRVGPTPAS